MFRGSLFRIRALLGLGIVGVGVIALGINECNMRSFAKATPKSLTCDELLKDGYGKNTHVVIRDYALSDNAFITSTRGRRGIKNSKTWIPVVPIDAARTEIEATVKRMKDEASQNGYEFEEEAVHFDPGSFRLLVLVKNMDETDDLAPLYERDTLQGLVTMGKKTISMDEMKLLRKQYGGVNLPLCYVLELDRKPAGIGMLALYFGGGLALIGLALFFGLRSGESN